MSSTHVSTEALPTLIDAHISARYPDLAIIGRTPSDNEKCFLSNYNERGYRLTTADLDKPLSKVFGKSMDQLRLEPLYIEWATPCLRLRPDNPDVYLSEFNKTRISTLAQFIKVFGK